MFDLRSRQELTSARYDPATMLWPGTERVSVPVFRPEEYAGDGGGGLVGRFDRFGTSVEVSIAFPLDFLLLLALTPFFPLLDGTKQPPYSLHRGDEDNFPHGS